MAAFKLHFTIITLCVVFINCEGGTTFPPPTNAPAADAAETSPEPAATRKASEAIPEQSIAIPEQSIHIPAPASKPSAASPSETTTTTTAPPKEAIPRAQTEAEPKSPPKAGKSGGMALSTSIQLILLPIGLLMCRT